MTTIEALQARHPEWRPWLGVVASVAPELEDSRWDVAVAPAAPAGDDLPLFAQTPVVPDARLLRELLRTLRRAALRNEVPALLPWNEALDSERDALAVFRAAIAMDPAALAALAARAGIEAGAFAELAALVPIPCLHACRRAWSDAIPRGWSEGYCPICGAWPAFAEACGIERSRYLRCGRCGSAWQSLVLRCVFCGTTDHERLGALRIDEPKERMGVEVCCACGGYLKAGSALGLTPAHQVMLVDLASVDLDIAAAMRDYQRPRGVGFRFER
jgi:FdhE protein